MLVGLIGNAKLGDVMNAKKSVHLVCANNRTAVFSVGSVEGVKLETST